MEIYTQVTKINTNDNEDEFCVYSDIFSYTNVVHRFLTVDIIYKCIMLQKLFISDKCCF